MFGIQFDANPNSNAFLQTVSCCSAASFPKNQRATHSRERSLMAALIVPLLLIVLCIPFKAFAHEELMRAYVIAYNAGDVAGIDSLLAPGATENKSDSALRDHAEFFSSTKEHTLVLRNLRWNDTRITSDYDVVVDGKHLVGSATFYVKDEKITRIVHAKQHWAESQDTHLADGGQLLDKGTTAVALSTGGFTEANPMLPGLTTGGAVALAAVTIGARQLVVKDLPLGDCVDWSRGLGTVGMTAGVSNLLIMAGLSGPAAPIVGVIAGIVAWNQNYKGECVDGDVRVAQI
jgi:hypothetical protein